MIHDIHIHTNLSSCASPDALPEGYIARLKDLEIGIAGFSNHLWDSDVLGASAWYQPQDVNHLLPLKTFLRENTLPDVKLLFGCETEFLGGTHVALTPEHAELFDYVLVPPHHFHMVDFVRPASISGGKPLADLFLTRFMEACDIPFMTGLAHPFHPIGFKGRELEVISLLPDSGLRDCFQKAADLHKTIEINASSVCALPDDAAKEYQHVMCIARECGCRFHFGSDAHKYESFTADRFRKAIEFAEKCGIVFPENPFYG